MFSNAVLLKASSSIFGATLLQGTSLFLRQILTSLGEEVVATDVMECSHLIIQKSFSYTGILIVMVMH